MAAQSTNFHLLVNSAAKDGAAAVDLGSGGGGKSSSIGFTAGRGSSGSGRTGSAIFQSVSGGVHMLQDLAAATEESIIPSGTSDDGGSSSPSWAHGASGEDRSDGFASTSAGNDGMGAGRGFAPGGLGGAGVGGGGGGGGSGGGITLASTPAQDPLSQLQSSLAAGNTTTSGLPDVTDLSAIPEPAAWPMMIAGFFGLGAMLRRTRKRRHEFTLSAR